MQENKTSPDVNLESNFEKLSVPYVPPVLTVLSDMVIKHSIGSGGDGGVTYGNTALS